MDALDQLSQYRSVDPVDDGVVTATVDVISGALLAANHRAVETHKPVGRYRRLGPGRRTAIAAGAVVAVIGAGGGIAAATGVFGLPEPPARSQSFMASSDPAKVPGAVLQLSIPGPDATTLQVVTDNVATDHQAVACVALGIVGPHGRPLSPGVHFVSCSGLVSPPGSPPPSLQQGTTPSMAVQSWKAPSGTSYKVIFGTAIPGVAAVTLFGGDGQVATTEPAAPNGYVVYLPSAGFPRRSHLDFTDKSGKIVYSQILNS